MAFDPSVISQIPDGAGNPEQAQQNAYTLYDSKNKVEMNSLNLAAAKQSQADTTATRNILKNEDLSTDRGVNVAAEKLSRAGLQDQAMKVKKDAGLQKSLDLDNEYKKYENVEKQVAPMINSIDSALSSLQDRKKLFDEGKITKADLDGATQRAVLPAIMSLKLEHPELAQHLDEFVKNPGNLTYDGLEAKERSTKDGRERNKSRLDEIKSAQAQHAQDTRDKAQETRDRNEQSLERDRLSLEKHRLASEGAERSKPEAGYNWKDPNDHSKGEEPIKGGSKDTEKPMTGREAQMFGRIVTSANLGIAALKNISQLPSSSSTGWLGTGKGPGPSLLGSTKAALQNKMSSQETQTYSAMIAGLSRNLSTIETQGLAPPGSFTQSLSAIQFAEGDTGYTKLTKLAEARQIVEKGLEPSLDNPRVPQKQKDEIEKMLGNLKDAIPYTNEDVIKLMQAHDKKPKTTMKDVMKEQGLTKPAGDLPPGFVLDK